MPGGRHAERRHAIDVLFQADVTGEGPEAVLATWREAGRDIGDFAAELVRGVTANRDEIDALLGEAAEGWTVDRMPAVDRTVLRVACLELRFREDVPPAVAIDEAVGAAKELSTEDSARFVNGVLGRVARG
ncbi:MAG: transcription antitermination factor NusB [Actinomycetota bacterium]